MIKLHSDCLIFETKKGEKVPCAAHCVVSELIGEKLDQKVIIRVAEMAVHYFRVELERECVSVDEFSKKIQDILESLGYTIVPIPEYPVDLSLN